MVISLLTLQILFLLTALILSLFIIILSKNGYLPNKITTFCQFHSKSEFFTIFFIIGGIIMLSLEIFLFSTRAAKAIELWYDYVNKLWSGNYINNQLENFRVLFSQLNFEQLWAISHIFSSVFILLCLMSIISVIYSDYLLNYLKIEDKYPKLGRIIKLRKMYQQYYLILNLLFIIITLMATIFINYAILTK